MKNINQILICALILTSSLACKKNSAFSPISNKQALLQFPYDTIVKYGWYYYENYDTSYTALDTIHTSSGWPVIPFFKVVPVLEQDACVLSTYYYFDESDGAVISIDCNGVKKNVASWQVYQDSTYMDGGWYINSFPLLVIISPPSGCYTPFTDTLPPNTQRPVFFTMIDSSQMNVSVDLSQFGWGNRDSVTIINNVMKHQ